MREYWMPIYIPPELAIRLALESEQEYEGNWHEVCRFFRDYYLEGD